MQVASISELDSASQLITQYQETRMQITSQSEGLDQGLVQQYLDEASIYLKQMPRVSQSESHYLGFV